MSSNLLKIFVNGYDDWSSAPLSGRDASMTKEVISLTTLSGVSVVVFDDVLQQLWQVRRPVRPSTISLILLINALPKILFCFVPRNKCLVLDVVCIVMVFECLQRVIDKALNVI